MWVLFIACLLLLLFLDINKFLWMVRIGGSTDRGEHIKENDYYTPSGEFRVDQEGSPTLLNCLMYKMCYYKFGAVYTEGGILKSISFINGTIYIDKYVNTAIIFYQDTYGTICLVTLIYITWRDLRICFNI